MTRHHPPIEAWLIGGAIVLGGCGSSASGEVETDALPTTVEGVVHVERTAVSLGTGAPDATTTRVSAKFLRVLPEDATRAQRLVGTRVIVPADGECAPIANLAIAPIDLTRLHRSGLKGAVELVDVGDISLRASTHGDSPLEMALTPRAFPDVGDVVSGVFYTQPDVASAASAADLPSPGSYVLTGTGASSVEPFAISADAPAMPANVRVAGQALGGGRSVPSIAEGRELVVEWDAPQAGDAEASIYVDVQGAQPYRCAFKDTGAATLPAEVVSRDDAGHAVTIAVHRAREENMRVDLAGHDVVGHDASDAVVRFDFARSGRFQVE